MKTLLALFALIVLFSPIVSTFEKVLNRQPGGDFLLAGEERGEEILSEESGDYNVQGHSLIRQGKIKEAAEKFREAIKTEPSSSDGYRNLGWCLYKLGQYKESKLIYEKGLELCPEDAWSGWSYGALGQNYIYLEEYELARDALEKAVARMPKLNWAYDNLGVAYHHLGKYEKAYWAYRKAVKLDPMSSWSYYNLGISCSELGKSSEAIMNFLKAILLGVPHRTEVYHRLILEYQRFGDPENAWKTYRELQAIDPEAASSLQSLLESEKIKNQGQTSTSDR